MYSNRHQFIPPETIPLTENDFQDNHQSAAYWLTSAGVMINSHGTIILIDPNIMTVGDPPSSEADENLRLLRLPPIYADQIRHVDAVLFTHADPDHMGPRTLRTLCDNTNVIFYGTPFTVNQMKRKGIPGERCISHIAGEEFTVGNVRVQVTPADHPWPVLSPPEAHTRMFGIEDPDWTFGPTDCCGFKVITPEGTVWHPGDTMLMGIHMTYRDVDAMFWDCGDDKAHFGTASAVRLFNLLSGADKILYHYGTLDAPDAAYASGDPTPVMGQLERPEKLKILAAGEKYIIKKKGD